MKIYLLKQTEDGLKITPRYDVYYGHIVIAENEQEARNLICNNPEPYLTVGDEGNRVWKYKKYSKCTEIGEVTYQNMEKRVVLSSFRAG